jgi:hypothetical protein
VHLDRLERTRLFRADSTFCPRPGAVDGSFALEAANYSGRFVRHRDGELWVDPDDGSRSFRSAASFTAIAPLRS